MNWREKLSVWWDNFRLDFMEQKAMERRHMQEKDALHAKQKARRSRLFDPA